MVKEKRRIAAALSALSCFSAVRRGNAKSYVRIIASGDAAARRCCRHNRL
jgi:hypothetical protein